MKQKLRLYSPHVAQLSFHSSQARYRVAALGRQSGKSTMCNNEILKRAWESPNTQYAFISPIFSQAKEQYRRQVRTMPEAILARKSDTELRLDLINGSIIEYLSGDNPHSIRGKTLHGVVIDEMRDQSPEIWTQIVRPMLATTKGWAAFVSTPNGFDAFYDLAQRAGDDKEWALIQSPSTCNPLFTQEEFDNAKKEMGEAEFAQEIMAEFRDLHNGSAYVSFSEDNVSEWSPFIEKGHTYTKHLPIVVGLDFNISPCAWVIGQERNGTFYFFDEIFMNKTHTQEMTHELISRIRALEIKNKLQVIIVGDATGRALKTATAGKSDYSILFEMLDEAGITYENRTPDSNPLVKDRVNTVNSKLKGADGRRHIFVHPNCKHLKKDLQRVSWKSGAQAILDQTTDKTLTHMSDAMGYVICSMSSMWSTGVGGLKVIRRN